MIPAIYVHETRATPYARAIVEGIKPIETRTRDMLGAFIGQTVLIIRTRDGKPADVVGSAFIASKRFYSAKELDELRNQTLIPPGSQFDCKARGKWGYTLTDPVAFPEPILLSTYNVTRKTRSYVIINKTAK